MNIDIWTCILITVQILTYFVTQIQAGSLAVNKPLGTNARADALKKNDEATAWIAELTADLPEVFKFEAEVAQSFKEAEEAFNKANGAFTAAGSRPGTEEESAKNDAQKLRDAAKTANDLVNGPTAGTRGGLVKNCEDAENTAKGQVTPLATAYSETDKALINLLTETDESKADNLLTEVQSKAAGVTTIYTNVQTQRSTLNNALGRIKAQAIVARRAADKAQSYTPEGRQRAAQIAQQVIDQDIAEKQAEREEKRMEEIRKLQQLRDLQEAEQGEPEGESGAPEAPGMMEGEGEVQPGQIVHEDPIGDTGGRNIAHFKDEIYTHPAAGDTDVNCLNQLDQCNDPAIAGRCAGTCGREANGQDHGQNCPDMRDLCTETHYNDLMTVYCKGTCVTGAQK